jgi:outer membrane protein assembly factor BamB
MDTPPVPGGAAFDGTDLWVSDFFARKINRLDATTGEVLQTIPAPGPYVGGLAWDGSTLWCLPEQTATIFQIDPSNGDILHSIPAPSLGQKDPNGSGLAWDGTALWHADYGMRRLYRLDPADGTILAQHTVTARMAAGLGFHSGVLVLADALSQEFLMIDASDGTLLSTCPSPGSKPWGVAREPSGDLWITDFADSTADRLSGGAAPWYENYSEALPNSTGTAASLSAEGSPSVESNNLVLVASNVPDGFGFFMYSRRQADVTWRGRMICVGRPAFRTWITRARGGVMSRKLDLTRRPGMRAGETWNFQAVFRDRGMGRRGFNSSDGMTITFVQ